MPKQFEEIKGFNTGIISSPSTLDIPKESSIYSLNIDPNVEQGAIYGIADNKYIGLSGWTNPRYLTYRLKIKDHSSTFSVNEYQRQWFHFDTYNKRYWVWLAQDDSTTDWIDGSTGRGQEYELFVSRPNQEEVRIALTGSSSTTDVATKIAAALTALGPPTDSFLYDEIANTWFTVQAEIISSIAHVKFTSNYYGNINSALMDNDANNALSTDFFELPAVDGNISGSGITPINIPTDFNFEYIKTIDRGDRHAFVGVTNNSVYYSKNILSAGGENEFISLSTESTSNDGLNNITSNERNKNLYLGLGNKINTPTKWIGEINRDQINTHHEGEFMEGAECLPPKKGLLGLDYDQIVVPLLHSGMNSTNSMIAGAASLYGAGSTAADFGGNDVEASGTLSCYRTLNGWIMKCLSNASIAFESDLSTASTDDSTFHWSSLKRGMIFRINIGQENDATKHTVIQDSSLGAPAVGTALAELRRIKEIGFADTTAMDTDASEGAELHDGDLFQVVTVPSGAGNGHDTVGNSNGDNVNYPRLIYVGSLIGNHTDHDSTNAYHAAPAWAYACSDDDDKISRIALSECNDLDITSTNQNYTFSTSGVTGNKTSNTEFLSRETFINLKDAIHENFKIGTIANCVSTDGDGAINGRVGEIKSLTINAAARTDILGDAGTDADADVYIKFTTTAAHSYITGDWVTISGSDDNNGTFQIISIPTTTTFVINNNNTYVVSDTTDVKVISANRNHYAGHGKLWVTSSLPEDANKIWLIDVVNWHGDDADNERVTAKEFILDFSRIHDSLISSISGKGLIQEPYWSKINPYSENGEPDTEGEYTEEHWADFSWQPRPPDAFIGSICETYSHQPHLDDGANTGAGLGRWRVWMAYKKVNDEDSFNKWDLFLFNIRPTELKSESSGSAFMYDKTPPYQECGYMKIHYDDSGDSNNGFIPCSDDPIYFPKDKFIFARGPGVVRDNTTVFYNGASDSDYNHPSNIHRQSMELTISDNNKSNVEMLCACKTQDSDDGDTADNYNARYLGLHCFIKGDETTEKGLERVTNGGLDGGATAKIFRDSREFQFNAERGAIKGGPMFKDPSGMWHLLEVGNHRGAHLDTYAGNGTEDIYIGMANSIDLGNNIGWLNSSFDDTQKGPRIVKNYRHSLVPYHLEWFNVSGTDASQEYHSDEGTAAKVAHQVNLVSKVSGKFVKEGGRLGGGMTRPVSHTHGDEAYHEHHNKETTWAVRKGGEIQEFENTNILFQVHDSPCAFTSSSTITEFINDTENRDFSSSSDWGDSGTTANQWAEDSGTYNEATTSGATEGTYFTDNYLNLIATSDASHTRQAILDGAQFESGMIVGRTYRLSYSIHISAYTSGTLSVGFANTSHAIDTNSDKTYTATKTAATDYFDFVYDGTTNHAEIVIQASTSSAFTVFFDNFSLKETMEDTVTGNTLTSWGYGNEIQGRPSNSTSTSDITANFATDKAVAASLGFSGYNQYRWGQSKNGTADIDAGHGTQAAYSTDSEWTTWDSYRGDDGYGHYNNITTTWSSVSDSSYTPVEGVTQNKTYYTSARFRNFNRAWSVGTNGGAVASSPSGFQSDSDTTHGGVDGTGYFTWHANADGPDGSESVITQIRGFYPSSGGYLLADSSAFVVVENDSAPDGEKWDNRRIVHCWSTLESDAGWQKNKQDDTEGLEGWNSNLRKNPRCAMKIIDRAFNSNDLEEESEPFSTIHNIDNIPVYDTTNSVNKMSTYLLMNGKVPNGEISLNMTGVYSGQRTDNLKQSTTKKLEDKSKRSLGPTRPQQKTSGGSTYNSKRCWFNSKLYTKNLTPASFLAGADWDLYCPIIVGSDKSNDKTAISVWRRSAWLEMTTSEQTIESPCYNYDRFYNLACTESEVTPHGFSNASGSSISTRFPNETIGSYAGTNAADSDTASGSDLTAAGAHYKTAADSLIKISLLPTDGAEVGEFRENDVIEYKISYLYDGFQDSPLPEESKIYEGTSSTVTNGLDQAYEGANVTVYIPTTAKLSLSKRVTHFIIWRRNNHYESYRLIKQIDLAKLKNYPKDENDRFVVRFIDKRSFESFENLTGMPSTLRETSLNYTISTQLNDFLFVTNAFNPNLEDSENFIFRSKPGKFSVFDWSNDFISMPSKPIALAGFAGKLYVFSREKLYRVDPDQLFVETVLDGIGILNQNSVVTTDYGMFFCDANNMYHHDGNSPKSIGDAILENSSNPEWSIGYKKAVQKALKEGYTPLVQFDARNRCVYFILQGYNEGVSSYINSSSRVYSYSFKTGRWDYLDMPAVTSTCIGRYGDVILADGHQIWGYRKSTHKNKSWSWDSKLFDMGSLVQKKSWKKIKITGSPTISDLNGSSNDDILVYVDGVQQLMSIESKNYSVTKPIAGFTADQNYGGQWATADTGAIYSVSGALPSKDGLTFGATITNSFILDPNSMPEFVSGALTDQSESVKEGEILTLKYISSGQYLMMEMTNSASNRSIKEIVKVTSTNFIWNSDNTISRVEIGCDRGQLGTSAYDFETTLATDQNWELASIRYVGVSLKFPIGTNGNSLQIKLRNQKGLVDSISFIYRGKAIK